MRLARLALVLALAVLGVTGTLASAAAPAKAPGTVTITDQGGDANAINSQGDIAPIPATKTPAQVAGADILSVAFGSTYTSKTVKGKTTYTITGLKVVMTLAAPPQGNVIFRATPTVGDCTTFDLTYSKFLDGKESSGLRDNCPGFAPALPTDGYEDVGVDSAVVTGSTITWTMRVGKSLPTSIKPGAVFSALSGHTRAYLGTSVTGGATVPVLDEISSADATYKFGK